MLNIIQVMHMIPVWVLVSDHTATSHMLVTCVKNGFSCRGFKADSESGLAVV
jgi:hypothetical protein